MARLFVYEKHGGLEAALDGLLGSEGYFETMCTILSKIRQGKTTYLYPQKKPRAHLQVISY